MMSEDGQRVDVVMDVEWLDDGSVRVHCLGVFTPGYPKPAGANVVQTWLNVERQRTPVGVFNIDTRTGPVKPRAEGVIAAAVEANGLSYGTDHDNAVIVFIDEHTGRKFKTGERVVIRPVRGGETNG